MTADRDAQEPAPERETDLSRFGYDDVAGLVIDNTHATGEPFNFDVDDDDDTEDSGPADA